MIMIHAVASSAGGSGREETGRVQSRGAHELHGDRYGSGSGAAVSVSFLPHDPNTGSVAR